MTNWADRLEGLPAGQASEWRERTFSWRPARGLGLSTAISQRAGWSSHEKRFDVPGVGHARSFHFEFAAPRGLQIRRASLVVLKSDGTTFEHVERGARNLSRVALYGPDQEPGYPGIVVIDIKVSAANLVRSLCLAGGIGVALLSTGYVKLDTLIDRSQGNVGPALALLLLLPGVIAGLVSRGDEHPVTTSMLFGLRMLGVAVAVFPALGALALVGFRRAPVLQYAWLALLAGASATFAILMITWLLAARRRPDGTSP
jgi:hypothetical protein